MRARLLVRVWPLQAEFQYERDAKPVEYMGKVVELSDAAVGVRWEKYYELFESVRSTVSAKFNKYMHRRGHEVGCCAVTCSLWLLHAGA